MGLKRRVQWLFGVIASPVGEDDYAEKGRRVELRRFVLAYMSIGLLIHLSGSSMGLLQSLNHSLNKVHLLGSCATPIMPKPCRDSFRS